MTSSPFANDFLTRKSFRILDDNKQLVPATALEFGEWGLIKNRRVACTLLNKRRDIYVSTVFIGFDMSWHPSKSLWFETMVFGTSIDQSMDRYETFEEAAKGHWKMVRRARQARQVRNRQKERLHRFASGRRWRK